MSGAKRSRPIILGEQRAAMAAAKLGEAVRASRRHRRLSQAALASMVGISRQRLGDLELGRGASSPSAVWFALGEALGRYLRFEFGRDPEADVVHAGHLAMQELVLRLGKAGGWEGRFELPTRPTDPARSSDAALLDRRGRRLALNECWNTFGDLGYATRSSDRKLHEAQALAAAVGGDDGPFQVGLCWIVRDTKANRATVARYRHIFESRFPGSSSGWVRALTTGAPMPSQPGLVWCDLNATRLFAHRRARDRPR
jgi:transcriptional regulator with XRE-family HTH domain